MTNLPKISVIMGVYNCESTVNMAIESIINQTYENWELIVCDDASTDSTYSVVKYYQNKFPEKIKLIKNNKNISLAPTLNRCLKLATGKYIARQDGDDLSIKYRFEKQVKFLEENTEYDLVGSSMISFDENREIGIRGIGKEVPDKFHLIKNVPFCHATILARRVVFEELNGYRVDKYTKRCEDLDLWFRFFKKGFKGYNLKQPLYKVRDDNFSYRRRTFRNYFNIFVIKVRGYKMLQIPVIKYISLIKLFIVPFIPIRILKLYHTIK